MSIKALSWWVFYTLFLLLVLFLFALLIRGLGREALGALPNVGELIYVIGLMMAAGGLMAMCIAYVVRIMWGRLRRERGAPHQGSRTPGLEGSSCSASGRWTGSSESKTKRFDNGAGVC